MKKIIALFCMVTIALTACSTEKPEDLVKDLVEASNTGDLENATALFGENAFVNIMHPWQCSPSMFSGRDEIRNWLSTIMAQNAQLGVEVLEVNEDTVFARTQYADDEIRDLGIAPLVLSEEYIIIEDKISSLTSVLTDESLAELQTAMSFPQEITSECLIGIWSGHVLFQFKDDGTFAVEETITLLEKSPVDYGEYDLIGTTLSFYSSENSKICPGFLGSYEISLTEEGRLKFIPIEDECGRRTTGLEHDYRKIE